MVFLFITNCGGAGGKEGDGKPDLPSSPVKHTTYSLVSRTRVAADAISDLIVKIKVENQEGKPVDQFTMRLLIPMEEGVNHNICSDSDSQGIVTCVLRSHKPGVKTFSIADSDYKINAEFTREHDGNALLFDVVAGGHALGSAGPDLVSGSIGKTYSVPIQESGTDLIINDVSVSN